MGDGLRAVPSGETHCELLDDWMLWMDARGLAERTVRERWQIVLRVAEGATVSPDGLTSRQILTYLARARIGQSTRANYHVALTAWFKWLVEQGHREDNPMARIPRPKVPRRRPRPAKTEHVEKLLATSMHRRTRTMILLALYQELNRAGVPLLTLRSLLRHASVQTTQLYSDTSEDQRASAIALLPHLDDDPGA